MAPPFGNWTHGAATATTTTPSSSSNSRTPMNTTSNSVHINNSNSNSNNHANVAVIIKPTEAQLKWAQFHHHRQASHVRERLEIFWTTPATIAEVDGACTDDGNTTAESSNSSNNSNSDNHPATRRRRRPRISRGRRALLRISQRRWKQRKEYIGKHGYQQCIQELEDAMQNDDEEDALEAIFEGTALRRRRRHRLRQQQQPTERSRRFEEAFLRMMERLASSSASSASHANAESAIAAPERIWTRPVSPAQDIDYAELKAGRRSALKNPTPAARTPVDRGASWLVHMPTATATKNPTTFANMRGMMGGMHGNGEHGGDDDDDDESEEDRQSQISSSLHQIVRSPVQNKCSSIVAVLQQHLQENTALASRPQHQRPPPPPMMKLGEFAATAADEKKEEFMDASRKRLDRDFAHAAIHNDNGDATPRVQNRVRQLQKEAAARPTRETVDAILQSLDPDLMQELETLEPGISEQLLERFLEEVGFDPREDEIDTAKAYLEVFARRYLVDARYFPEKQQQQSSGTKRAKAGGLVQRFVAQMEASGPAEGLVSADGKLHKPTFALMIQRYLEETGDARRRTSSGSVRAISIGDRYLAAVPPPPPPPGSPQTVTANAKNNSDSVVGRLLANLERGMEDIAADEDKVVDADGNLDQSLLEGLVTRYLAEASGMDEGSVLSADDLPNLMATTQSTTMSPPASRNLVERLVAAIETQGGDQLAMDDGKLDIEFFESLMRDLVTQEVSKQGTGKKRMGTTIKVAEAYLGALSNQKQSEQPLRGAKPPSGGKKQSTNGNATNVLVGASTDMNQSIANTVPIRDGTVDRGVVKGLVSKYLSATCNVPETIVLRAEKLQGGQQSASQKPAVQPPAIPKAFIDRFVERVGQAADVKEIVEKDGQLDRQKFERLVTAYLNPATTNAMDEPTDYFANARSPLALAEARRSAGVGRKHLGDDMLGVESSFPEPVTAKVVSRFVDAIENAGKDEPLVDSNGKLDKERFLGLAQSHLPKAFMDPVEPKPRRSKPRYPKMETGLFVQNLVTEMMTAAKDVPLRRSSAGAPIELAKLRGVVEESILNVYVGGSGPGGILKEHAHAASSRIVDSMSKNSLDQEFIDADGKIDKPLCEALLWRFIEEDAQSQNRKLPVHAVGLGGRRSLSSDQDDQQSLAAKSAVSELTYETSKPRKGRVEDKEEQGVDETSPESALHRMGGFFKRMSGENESVGGETTRSAQQQLLAAFHRSREDRNSTDDTTSISSFRVLPEGFKNVVRNLRGPRLSPSVQEEDPHKEDTSQDRVEQSSPSNQDRSEYSIGGDVVSTSKSEFSPERVKHLTAALMEESETGVPFIDTDGNESDIDGEGRNSKVLATLLLSPTILTKRLHQVIGSVESKRWDQVDYLLKANPWLAEMLDVHTQQYVLHKVALFGSPENTQEGAPESLNVDLVRMFPAAVQKFDEDGNLPLHMACASANLPMIQLLGDRFSGGASVRNEEGMLPLHLAVLACAAASSFSAVDVIRQILDYFPGAVAVADNEGNLPIHTAASSLRGSEGADIVHLLLEEAESLSSLSGSPRFRNRVKIQDVKSEYSMDDSNASTPTQASSGVEEVEHCNLVRNEDEDTPLLLAIKANSGWEVIEALIYGPGGLQAARQRDLSNRSPLHLLLGDKYYDPAGALSVLKISPEAAFDVYDNGKLPFEVACRQRMPPEVIFALVLVDLPFDLNKNDFASLQAEEEKSGKSWWYITCSCDDRYAGVVEEVLRVCSYPQVRRLCFAHSEEYDNTLIHHASPRCRKILQKSLRFVGRYEFKGQAAVLSDEAAGVQVFEALDFGPQTDPYVEGTPVFLKCFTKRESFLEQKPTINSERLDFDLVDRCTTSFVDINGELSSEQEAKQFCIAVERPNLTLGGVLVGMLGSEDCQSDFLVRQRYAHKIFSLLRLVAKSLNHLHAQGIVHGSLSVDNCAKYGPNWKLAGASYASTVGNVSRTTNVVQVCPPEMVEVSDDGVAPCLRQEVQAAFAHDIWSFGTLAYEVLVGEKVVPFDIERGLRSDIGALSTLMTWNENDVNRAATSLQEVGVTDRGVELIADCLSPHPEKRPDTAEVLNHSVWQDMRQLNKLAKVEGGEI